MAASAKTGKQDAYQHEYDRRCHEDNCEPNKLYSGYRTFKVLDRIRVEKHMR